MTAALRFRRLHPDSVVPTRAHSDDAGLDLCCLERFSLEPGERAAVGTGLAVEIPPGHGGLVLPRSGLAMKHGIALVNSPGLIDSGYRGEIRVLLLNTDRTKTFEAAAGDRIAQLLVVAHGGWEPLEVDSLSSSERGDGGFGSSGTGRQAE